LSINGNDNYVNGTIDGAITFTVSDTLIGQKIDESNFDFAHNEAFSIGFWILGTNTGTERIFTKGTPNDNSFLISIADGATNDKIRYEYTVNLAGGDRLAVNSADVVIRDGNWHYIVVKKSTGFTAADVNFYLDGTSLSTSTVADGLTQSFSDDEPIYIGDYQTAAGHFVENHAYDYETSI